MPRHDFYKHMAKVKDSIAADYEKIRASSSEDPGTAGEPSEEDWAEILRKWLPAIYPVITKGRILFEDGSASPQVVILVLKPTYPIGLRSEKYVFDGGIVAAFECKLTLRAVNIKDAFKTSAKIKQKIKATLGTPYDELNSAPIYRILAHSHAFREKRPSWKIHEVVEKYQLSSAQHPRELLDIICVADATTMPLTKIISIGPNLEKHEIEELAHLECEEIISTMYVIHDEGHNPEINDKGSVLASLIYELTHRIAFEDSAIRDWSDHLSAVGVYGGIGRPIYWTSDELAPEVLKTLHLKGRDENSWSKWNAHVP